MDGLSRVICVAVVERKEGQVKPTAAFYHGKRNGCAMVMVVTMVTNDSVNDGIRCNPDIRRTDHIDQIDYLDPNLPL